MGENMILVDQVGDEFFDMWSIEPRFGECRLYGVSFAPSLLVSLLINGIDIL